MRLMIFTIMFALASFVCAGEIVGKIQDQKREVIAKARITLEKDSAPGKGKTENFRMTVNSDENGNFNFGELEPGVYSIVVDRKGIYWERQLIVNKGDEKREVVLTLPCPWIVDPIAIIALLMLVPAFLIWLEKKTGWKIFEYLPPIIWIFLFPIIFSTLKIIPSKAVVYDSFKGVAVPLFIILMLLDVDIRQSLRVAGKSVFVLIAGAFGVVIGAVAAFAVFKAELPEDSWRGFGALAGSWIGGTGNMAAVKEAVDVPSSMMAIVVLADTLIYIIWFPVLLACKKWAGPFNRFVKIDEKEQQAKEKMLAEYKEKSTEVSFYNILVLVGFALLFFYISQALSKILPQKPPVFTASTWKIMLVTTFGLLLSITPLKKVPGTNALSMALVYTYMSMIAAECDIQELVKAPLFLIAAFACIVIHGICCLLAAKLFKVDIHLVAIASAANIGGAASAPVVAAHHRKELVPVSIILALVGYGLGNYLGWLTSFLCYKVM